MKHDWLPWLTTLVANLVALGVIYGKLDQRVTTLETLRLEAKAETSSQLGDVKRSLETIDAKITAMMVNRK